ncbi:alpha/beta hydrolase fold domain-containing protein [Paracoccus pacificus]|uniref:Alpha/beta hydrolase fold domain-containing protein n=1 Tax=Paracoccus pacificus TaxID=1463598 RepID=A0ABW4R9H6_9RHOB
MSDFSAKLAPELVAVQAAADAELGPASDLTLLPADQGRARFIENNRWWNRDLPALERVETVIVPASDDLGTPQLSALWLVPPQARPGVVVYVHGGGFAFGSPATHERFASELALASGRAVLSPNYRLSPEFPFPAGLMDVVATLRAADMLAASARLHPGPVAVAGDSAGANLALAALLYEIAAGRPSPASAAALFYGVFDADFDSPSYQYFSDGPGLTRGKMQRYWDWYLPDPAARADPLASPLRAEPKAMAALPPLFLLAAGIDPLLSDTERLAVRLAEAGRPVDPVVVPGVTHGFLQMTRDLPQAREAAALAGAFLREHG